MIALDTNVLARYVVGDEARQTAAARRLIESSCTNDAPGVVSLLVLCELVWVLVQGYGYRRDQVALVLRRLLAAQDLAVERSDLARQALNLHEEGPADFSDYVIGLSGRSEGAEATCTFDRRGAKSPLFRLVPA
ncbi:MAG TPA: type II toxin-antitoxin system VapC family toxin [Vicinamibacteria bacterium]|nr:type II toxin-antitoxin system VapC family toxin [Vicinamibacteria bacterium]